MTDTMGELLDKLIAEEDRDTRRELVLKVLDEITVVLRDLRNIIE